MTQVHERFEGCVLPFTPCASVFALKPTCHVASLTPQVRERAKAALKRFTTNALSDMRAAAEAADAADSSGGLDMGLMLLRVGGFRAGVDAAEGGCGAGAERWTWGLMQSRC